MPAIQTGTNVTSQELSVLAVNFDEPEQDVRQYASAWD
jgi:hypothetical protein